MPYFRRGLKLSVQVKEDESFQDQSENIQTQLCKLIKICSLKIEFTKIRNK